jgi:hypothetical protein
MHQFILERAEEAFDDGIVIAIAFATHAAHQPMLSQQALVGDAGIEGPLIGVMNETRLRAAMHHGHVQRLERDVLIRLWHSSPSR